MYNMFEQLRLFAYNQLLSKKVSSTKIDDVEEKDVPLNSKNKVLQDISANLEESDRILLEKTTISCREIKSKSDTDIKDSSKTILNTAKKCLSLSDLKKHIACMNIKKFTRTETKDTTKPNTCSSGDSEKKTESIKSQHQSCHKHEASDESPSCDLFGFYKNRRRKHISPYELYVHSVKPVISKNFNKLKKCGSKVIRHERGAKHIPFPSSHHALKVITSNHNKTKAASEYEDDVFNSMECFKNRGEPNYKPSLPKQDHKNKHKLPSKNESIMCHLTENHKRMHHLKKKRRVFVPRSVQKNQSVDVACGNISANQSIPVPVVSQTSSTQKLQAIDASADQSLGFPKFITPNQPPKHEFGCSPLRCVPKCECMLNTSQSVIEIIENATQTSIYKHQYRTFSCYLPKSYKKSVKCITNLHIDNPDPKSVVKYILICLVVTVWSPVLLAISIGWLLSYPLRPGIVCGKNVKSSLKNVNSCKNISSCHKPRQTKLQSMLQVCTMQPSQRQNQARGPYAWRTLCCCRRRELRRNYCIFHANCKTNPLHASQHRANTITNFFHGVFCSRDKIHQSNVSSFRARRNKVALKTNTLKEPTLIDNRTMQPIMEFSHRMQQNSEANNTIPIQDKGTVTEPKRKSVNLQTHDDQNKSVDDFKWSSFFSPFMKLVENYLVHSKYMTLQQQIFLNNTADGRESESKYPQWQSSQKSTTFYAKNLRSQPRYSCRSNKRMNSPQGPFLLSKETKKHDHKKQKVINFGEGLFKNTENCKLSNKNTETDPLNQQIKRKNLHWKVSQTAHETQTNFNKITQKPVGHRNHSAFNSPRCRSPHTKETKCLNLVSSNCISPVCDKTKEVNTTINLDLPLSETTKSQGAHSFTAEVRPTSGHTESLGHRTKEVTTTTEIYKNKNFGSSLNFLPSVLSEPNKHPLGDDISIDKSRKKVGSPVSGHAKSLSETKKANAAVGTDQMSKPSANYDSKNGLSVTNNELTHARSSFFKSSNSGDIKCLCGTWNKIKKTSVSIGTDQKPQASNSSNKQIHKLTQGSSTSKYPISSEVECSCDLKGKETSATVGMNQKSKSNCSCECHIIKLPYIGPAVRLPDCKCPMSDSTKNVCHCHKKKYANTAVETDNSCCPCPPIRPIKLPPACSAARKCHITRNSKNLCHNCYKMKKANTPVKTDKKPKSNTSCQCHLLKPTQLPPDLSSCCECPDIANTEGLCQNCHKKPEHVAVKTGQYSELSSSNNFQRSKHNNLSRDGLQEENEAVGTEAKSKFRSGERMELNDVPYDFFNTTFQQDALNVYKLCPINGDTNSLKNTKLQKKHQNNKTPTNKCIHTPEYLNVCSEVCGDLVEKKCFAHSISNNNEKCHVNKQTRTSKSKANSPRNTKNVNNCIRESIEAKQPNSLESPFNVTEYGRQQVTVGCSKSCCKVRCSNKSEVNTDKVTKSSWTTRCPNAGTTDKTFCANKHCKMKKEIQSAYKPIQAKNNKICADKSQFCPCPPSEQRNFSNEERKCCSSQTFKKATFAIPHSISCNEQTCKIRKPTRAKYLAYAFYDFISGKKRRKKYNTEPFETQTSGILIKTSDCKSQNYETESQQCYGNSTEPKSRNINTALCSINNLKTGGRKNYKNKSMEFNYFTMLKDLIDSKTLQKRNVSAQCNKKNRQQSKKYPLCNNMVQMQKQNQCVPSDGLWVPPLVPCACVSPCVSSVRSLEQPVITKCKCPVQVLDPKPSFPISCSQERDVSVKKKQQICSPSHNSSTKKTNQQWQGLLNTTRAICTATNTPNTSNPKLSLKRSTNIQQKLSNLRCSINEKTSKQKLLSQPGLKISKPVEQKTSSQTCSNILEEKEQKIPLQLSSNIPETKKSLKNVKLSCELISGKGDGNSNKTGRRHLRPRTQATVTGTGDNCLSFNDKRDLIKMCFKRKVKLTPSLVKCLSDSFDLVHNRRKHCPRIIEHIKFDKCCKQNKRHRIKLECNGTTRLSKATGIEEECTRTKINKPIRQDNIKCEKGMGDAGQFKLKECECKEFKNNDCECQQYKKQTKKIKPPPKIAKIHHKKIPERKKPKVQHIPDKKPIRKKPVKKKIVKKKKVIKKPVKSTKKKTPIRRLTDVCGEELPCSDMYIATLRKRPCFWVYKLLPKCYPSFLRFRLCTKTVCIQCAFSLTCCFWAPFVVICFICFELFNCC